MCGCSEIIYADAHVRVSDSESLESVLACSGQSSQQIENRVCRGPSGTLGEDRLGTFRGKRRRKALKITQYSIVKRRCYGSI